MKIKVYYFQKTDVNVTLQKSIHVENEWEPESHVETRKLNARLQILLSLIWHGSLLKLFSYYVSI